jgi:hypothetical protein
MAKRLAVLLLQKAQITGKALFGLLPAWFGLAINEPNARSPRLLEPCRHVSDDFGVTKR